jgi:hypothetical protein
MACAKRKKKMKTNHKLLKTTLGVFAVVFSICSVRLLCPNWFSVMPSEPDESDATFRRAVVVDGLYSTRPDSVFTENIENILKEAGFHVSFFQGDSVTVDLLRNIGGYELVVLRLHSGVHTDNFLYLFSAEPYTEFKYVTEQLSRVVRKAYTFDEDDPPVFALNSVLLGASSPKGLSGSTIILMGCNGTGDSYSIERYFERGAKAYVAWDGYVDISHSDEVILELLRDLYSRGLNLEAAVKKVTNEIGPDPFHGSSLKYYVSN